MARTTKQRVSEAPQKTATAAELRDWYNKNSGVIERYAKALNAIRQIRDANDSSSSSRRISTFNKQNLRTFLQNISTNEKNLRNLSRYLYYRSQVYYRIIAYFANMFDLRARSVIPDYDFIKPPSVKDTLKQYNETLSYLDQMNLQYEFLKIYVTCFRQDVFYGCLYWDDSGFFILPLDPDYCKITGEYKKGGDFSFAMDMSYFRSRAAQLELWGEPFQSMYKQYESNSKSRYVDMPDEYAACFKVRAEDWDTVVPPFSGLFNELINLEDLKDIQAVADEAQIYKLLWIKLSTISGSSEVDDWAVDPDTVVSYYKEMLDRLPDYVDVTIVPGDLSAITFDQDETTDTSKVERATETVLNTSGGAQILNSASISGTTAFNAAIKSDTEFAISFLLPQTEAWVNRQLSYKVKKPAKVKFFEISVYTRDDFRDSLLKSAQYGLSTKLAINTLNGFSERETMAMNFLEEQCLDVTHKFVPLQSSYTQSGTPADQITGGRPESDKKTDDGEASEDKKDRSKG